MKYASPKHSFSSLTVALIAALTTGLFTSESMAAGNATENDSIVVTASKQSQYAASSQNVASYRISSDELEQANVTSSRQLDKVLPGVSINKSDSFLYPFTAIRGMTSLDYYNSALTIYIDGVPQPPIGMIQPLGDIQSIEMLKGPQSTLYGKAAEGGVVNITTEQPGANYQGYLSAGYASRNSYRGKLNVSGPIADGLLYGSITALRQAEQGRLTNPGSGHKNLNGQQNDLGTLRLRLAPDNQPWEINAAYTAQCEDSSQALFIPFTNNLRVSMAALEPGTPDPQDHRCIHNQSVRGQYNTGQWLFSAVGSWQQIDLDRKTAYPGYPDIVHSAERWLVDVQELRAATQGKQNVIDAVLGLYRENIRRQYHQDNSLNQRQSLAAYTDVTWHTTDRLDFGGGLRFSHDKSTIIFNNDQAAARGETIKNHLSGQLSAGYQLTDADRFYLRIAQGYQSGGFDYAPGAFNAYQPEQSLTYELGNRYHSDKLNIQGAVFYTRVQDFQMYLGELGRQTLQNAGDARIVGLELAGDYVFLAGWKVGANINLNNSKFTSDKTNGLRSGKRMPSVPEYSGGLYLTGNIDTAIGRLSPYVGFNVTGSYDYRDADDRVKQATYTTADIRLAWQATDRITVSAYLDNVFDKRYSAYVYTTEPGNLSSPLFASVNNGRTAGVDVKIELF